MNSETVTIHHAYLQKDLQTVKDAGYIEEASPVLVYDSERRFVTGNAEEETLLWGS